MSPIPPEMLPPIGLAEIEEKKVKPVVMQYPKSIKAQLNKVWGNRPKGKMFKKWRNAQLGVK